MPMLLEQRCSLSRSRRPGSQDGPEGYQCPFRVPEGPVKPLLGAFSEASSESTPQKPLSRRVPALRLQRIGVVSDLGQGRSGPEFGHR